MADTGYETIKGGSSNDSPSALATGENISSL